MDKLDINNAMYQKVLVAIDFSENSYLAVEKAQKMAKFCGANIELIHVVEIPTYPILEDVAVMGMPGIWDDDIAKSLISASDNKLKKLANDIGVTSFKTVEGIATIDIVEYAKQNKCDLIVMGTHGVSGFKALIGSTTNSVVNHACCDVLAVKLKD